jgi:hypothetical protein
VVDIVDVEVEVGVVVVVDEDVVIGIVVVDELVLIGIVVEDVSGNEVVVEIPWTKKVFISLTFQLPELSWAYVLYPITSPSCKLEEGIV